LENGLENIDEVFKQTFKGFEANVNPSVWNNVQQSITSGNGGANTTPKVDPSAASGVVVKSMVMKIVAGVILVGAVATTTYLVVTGEKNNKISENVVVDKKINEPKEELKISVNTEEQTGKEEEIITDKNTDIVVNSVEETKVDKPVTETSPQTEVNVPNSNKISAPTNTSKNTDNTVNDQENNTNVNIADSKTLNEPTVNKHSNESEIAEAPVKSDEKFEIVIPNVITPNGDGMNDVIKIPGENIEKIEVVIMDKAGKPVFTFKTIDDVFEGKDQTGYNLLPGVYYMAGVVVDKNGKPHNIKQIVNLLK